MLISINQHLSSIWSSIMKKLSNTEAELKKRVAYKKNVYIEKRSLICLVYKTRISIYLICLILFIFKEKNPAWCHDNLTH